MKTALRHRLAAFAPTSLRALLRDRSGIGGVEFAIVAPLLLVAYLGAFEISVGFSVAQKVSQASTTVADLLTQQAKVNKAYLDGMKTVAMSVMAPFTVSSYTLKITGIKVTAENKGIVKWSRDQLGGTPYATGLEVAVPASTSMIGTFMVRSEFVVPHEILLMTSGTAVDSIKTIDISRTSYYRQRVGTELACDDCNS